MYFENNRRAPQNRADADFLRRMMGGELNGSGCDHGCSRAPVQPRRGAGQCCEQMPQARMEEAPQHPGNGCGCHACNVSCPTEIPAPSLAMVYCPRQCWRNLFDPAKALAHGTLFAELVLPFEGNSHNGRKEGCARRPM